MPRSLKPLHLENSDGAYYFMEENFIERRIEDGGKNYY